MRAALALIAAAAAIGLALGAYFASQAIDDTSVAEQALKPGEVEIPPGTPVASLALPMDYGRFRIIPYGNVPNYTPDWLPPPGVQKVGMDINTSDTLDEFRDHELFIEPPYIPAGWELTWAHAQTVIWDDGSRRDSTFGLQYDRPEYFYIRIKRFHIAPEGQVELLAPPASAQDALILNEVRGVPAVFVYGGVLKVHFLVGNVLTRVEGVAIDFDELIKIADALIAHTEEPTATAPAAQLPLTRADIQLSADGKYFVPDRGDGCAYEEVSRYTNDAGALVVSLQAPNCSAPLQQVFLFVPDTGELRAIPIPPPPSTPPAKPSPQATPPSPTAEAAEWWWDCPPCEGRIREQLKISPEDVQLGADDKYYVPDRGDGCVYEQIPWSPMRDPGWVTLYAPRCARMWLYLPATGEVQGLVHCPCWEVKGRDQLEVTAEDIQLDADGKYYIPDGGDGCAYRETGRGMLPGPGGVKVEVVFLWAPGCEMGWTYEPATGRLNATIP